MASLKNRTGYLYFYKEIPTMFKEDASNAVLSSPLNNRVNLSKKLFKQDLWITRISQPNQLSGQSYQSRFTKHFYPRYYSPGNLSVECITNSQQNYQEVATFIRGHHKFMANLPTSTYAQSFQANISPFLMTLSIPNEGILLQGIVPSFNLNKKGVFDPAPAFNFDFIILYDSSRSSDAYVSSAVKTWQDIRVGDSLDVQREQRK